MNEYKNTLLRDTGHRGHRRSQGSQEVTGGHRVHRGHRRSQGSQEVTGVTGGHRGHRRTQGSQEDTEVTGVTGGHRGHTLRAVFMGSACSLLLP
ncbi:hypothetical protein EYF80_067634 [Liparis tanakae]|uniref:Uncharacterized protein n=1 Tax=Liparis tanakae TaxID=230148 RepID=A0A4Z2E1K2_9TELE|nr:hypothetical protein EYF80_067634 [Liparis tanakae]